MTKAWLGTFGELGHPYSHPSAKQCTYAYTHPSDKQCNYSYTHPSTKQCNYSYTHPSSKQCDAAAGNHTHTPASIGAAASSHYHDAGNITSGTLPAARGGTGVTSLDALKSALGLPSANLFVETGTYTGAQPSDTSRYGRSYPQTLTFVQGIPIVVFITQHDYTSNANYFTSAILINTQRNFTDHDVQLPNVTGSGIGFSRLIDTSSSHALCLMQFALYVTDKTMTFWGEFCGSVAITQTTYKTPAAQLSSSAQTYTYTALTLG